MRRRALAICLLFIIGSIVGCGETRQSQATSMCKEMLREGEAPGSWESADRRGVLVSDEVSAIHGISPERMWEIRFLEWPVSQVEAMNTGIEWKATIEIYHALQVTFRGAEEAEWIDVLAFCTAECNERMHLAFEAWRKH